MPANELNTPVKNIAALHSKAKLELFSHLKRDGIKDHSFRADCVLACYFIIDVPIRKISLITNKKKYAIFAG